MDDIMPWPELEELARHYPMAHVLRASLAQCQTGADREFAMRQCIENLIEMCAMKDASVLEMLMARPVKVEGALNRWAMAVQLGRAIAAYPGCPNAWWLKPEDL